jgi:hypothetical protein
VIPEIGRLGFFLQFFQLTFFPRYVKDAPSNCAFVPADFSDGSVMSPYAVPFSIPFSNVAPQRKAAWFSF